MKGLWVGFGWKHQKEHFCRSILESIAYEYKRFTDIFKKKVSIADGSPIRSYGGGLRSCFWNQIKEDVLNRKIQILVRNDLITLVVTIIESVSVGIIF